MRQPSVASAEQYAAVIKRVLREGVPEKHLELLRLHYEAPRRTRTATELARGVGYTNFGGVNLQYGKLAGRIGRGLGLTAPPEGFWLYVLVKWASTTEPISGHTRFVLRPEVVEAVQLVGLPWAK